MNHARAVRLPVHVVREMRAITRLDTEAHFADGKRLRRCDLASKANKERAEVELLLQFREPAVSVDTPLAEGANGTFVDNIRGNQEQEPERQVERKLIDAAITRWLGLLSPREKEIIGRRFGLDGHPEATLDEIGADIGLTRERVRQIQIRSLKLLHTSILAEGLVSELID